MTVDLSKVENQQPQQDLEAAEDITCFWVPMDNLLEEIEKIADEQNCQVSSVLQIFALGAELSK